MKILFLSFFLYVTILPQEIDTLYLFPDTTTFHDPLTWTDDVINAAIKYSTDLPEFSLKSILFIRPDWAPTLPGGIAISTGNIPEETVIFDTSFTIIPAYPDWNEVVFEPRVNIYSSFFYISGLPYEVETYVHYFLPDTLIMGQYRKSEIVPTNNGWVEGLYLYFAFKVVIEHKLSGVIDNELIPNECKLYDCYPNPFNPKTNIEYQINNCGFVNLSIINFLGEELIRLEYENKPAGIYKTEFNAKSLPSGVYFCRLIFGEDILVKKLLIIK